MSVEFQPWPKIGRVEKRRAIATEKIDGTNAQILVHRDTGVDGFNPLQVAHVVLPYSPDEGRPASEVYTVFAGSRKRWVTPKDDNYGFAHWVHHNAENLVKVLGPGRHYGEWWGDGIQKNPLGLPPGERRFSLFNTSRWFRLFFEPEISGQLTCVPILAKWTTVQGALEAALPMLDGGSQASGNGAPAEGVVIYEASSGTFYKHIIGSTGPKGAS